MNIKFRTEWFDRKCRALWDEHLKSAVDGGVQTYLEIGVGEGHSMRWVLENLKPKLAIGVDPYIPKRDAEIEHYASHKRNMQANLAEWLRDGTLEIIYKNSYDVLTTQMLREFYSVSEFDLIYVDGNHQCFPCAMDCMLCWHLVKEGGIMIMDDFNRRFQRGWGQSYEGIKAFLDAAYLQYDSVWGNPLTLDVDHLAIRKVRHDWIRSDFA